MKQPAISKTGWVWGAFAALIVAAAAIAASTEGVTVKAGGVEMTVGVSSGQGLAVRFEAAA